MCVFSFHPVKSVTSGEGGVVTTNSADLADRLRRFRNHGMDRTGQSDPWRYEIRETGFNYRLSDIHAALGRSQMAKLDRFVTRRNELADRYDALLAGLPVVTAPAPPPGVVHARHLYPVRVQDRARVYAGLRDAGIGVQVHYVPVHQQPLYDRPGGWDLPNTDRAYERAAVPAPVPGPHRGPAGRGGGRAPGGSRAGVTRRRPGTLRRMSVRGGPENGRSPGIDPPGVEAWVGAPRPDIPLHRRARDRPDPDRDWRRRLSSGRTADAMTSDGTIVVEPDGDRPAATAILTPKPMETELLGVPTAALSTVVCPIDAPGRIDVVRRLLQRAMSEASRQGARLVIFRVDADDVETLAAAQSAGLDRAGGHHHVPGRCRSRRPVGRPPAGTAAWRSMRAMSAGHSAPRMSTCWPVPRPPGSSTTSGQTPGSPPRPSSSFYRAWVHNIAVR